MKKDMLATLKSLRRISAPLVAIRTADPAATLVTASATINGNSPKVLWDASWGFAARNEAGEAALAEMLDGQQPDACTNPADALLALLFPQPLRERGLDKFYTPQFPVHTFRLRNFYQYMY
jgi:hypothetical protein